MTKITKSPFSEIKFLKIPNPRVSKAPRPPSNGVSVLHKSTYLQECMYLPLGLLWLILNPWLFVTTVVSLWLQHILGCNALSCSSVLARLTPQAVSSSFLPKYKLLNFNFQFKNRINTVSPDTNWII